ncbi:MAG: tetratricopeptide repeat protein [Candidatus Undinarchaeales archaeon]|jgi:tetratricopeptide (TPR) repeat protein|nr:tetratricopeptide repeat protein [Candidatus Undinarchaeales archaeon]MDP7493727.1 tetratricopeptide repeat protein [Candidatus Undinarchaeales archaeon]
MSRKAMLGRRVLSDLGRAVIVFFLIGVFAQSVLADLLIVTMFYYVLRAVFRSFVLATNLLTDEDEAGPLDGIIPSPVDQNEMEDLAKALLHEGEFEETLDLLDKALEADPTDAKLYLLRGMTLRHLAEDGGSDELVRSAIRDLQSAMVLSRSIASIPQTDLLVGRLFARLGEKAKARRHLQRVLAHSDAPEHVLEEARRTTASLS